MESISNIEVYHCGAESVSCVIECDSDIRGYIGYFLVV